MSEFDKIKKFRDAGDIPPYVAKLLKRIGRIFNENEVPWRGDRVMFRDHQGVPDYVIMVREKYDIIIKDRYGGEPWQFIVNKHGARNFDEAVISSFTVHDPSSTEHQITEIMKRFIMILGKPIPMDEVVAASSRAGKPKAPYNLRSHRKSNDDD